MNGIVREWDFVEPHADPYNINVKAFELADLLNKLVVASAPNCTGIRGVIVK